MITRLFIERKSASLGWETFSYPGDDVQHALRDLEYFRELEIKKRYPKPLRLVRETREILA